MPGPLEEAPEETELLAVEADWDAVDESVLEADPDGAVVAMLPEAEPDPEVVGETDEEPEPDEVVMAEDEAVVGALLLPWSAADEAVVGELLLP